MKSAAAAGAPPPEYTNSTGDSIGIGIAALLTLLMQRGNTAARMVPIELRKPLETLVLRLLLLLLRRRLLITTTATAPATATATAADVAVILTVIFVAITAI